MTRITIDEFNAKLAAAERVTDTGSMTSTRRGVYYHLYTGLNCVVWFVGLALDEKPLQVIVERVG